MTVKFGFVPDAHVPYHDKRAWAAMVAGLRDFAPDVLIVLGDLLDCYAVSSHLKYGNKAAALVDELAEGCAALDDLDSIGATDRVYLEGNHEHRLRKYLLRNARALDGLVDLPSLLDLSERGWRWVPYRSDYMMAPGYYACHDAGHSGIHALKTTMRAYGESVVMGHIHRVEVVQHSRRDGSPMFGACFGWLGSEEAAIEYMYKAKMRFWQHGYGIGWLDNGRLHVRPVEIRDGKATLGAVA